MTAGYVAMPSTLTDLMHAARDPLSPIDLLTKLYHDYKLESAALVLRGHPLAYLAYNSSLPLDVFNNLFAHFERIEYGSSLEPTEADLLSNFFPNPLTTFEQVLGIVCNSHILANIVGIEGISSSKTVVEIFDRLRLLTNASHVVFISKLLSSPLVSDEDFRLRTTVEDAKLKLHYTIFSSPRFIPRDTDYRAALDVMDDSGGYVDFNYGLSIAANPNSSSDFLTKAIERAGGKETVESWIYSNLNCPIELSAHFMLKNLAEYRWRPSELLILNLKANDYLAGTQGDGPWEDLPL